ncbi:hypothetical protein [Methylobacterium dankookense]|uniref:DUF1652 domain-containing protein n=1 Tax=Methylobacterium dankookense TaxID=560405 RepID=A0A564G3J4_9HYPH|nr:hypothetical protein [Methylobacterium dankookense]GJD59815.1 hypothetical protein IFDJLNFL_5746 [Methylobacterium dankookense]VUF15073.1 hypothetical protein MTDSW087_04806 [Methylobacterium dankookense]
MAARPDYERAASISVAGCEACACGNIHVRLHDQDGEVFAVAPMPVPTAVEVFNQLKEHLIAATRDGLSAMRCEGVA